MLVWNDSFSVGIEEIDNQHMKLFDIGNEAYNLLKNDYKIDKFDEIIEIIEKLKDYTVFHFKAEEQYMKKIKYPNYFQHKIVHLDFVNKLNAVNFSEIDGSETEYLKELVSTVCNWVCDHILKDDKAYEKYLSEIS